MLRVTIFMLSVLLMHACSIQDEFVVLQNNTPSNQKAVNTATFEPTQKDILEMP